MTLSLASKAEPDIVEGISKSPPVSLVNRVAIDMSALLMDENPFVTNSSAEATLSRAASARKFA